MPGLSGERRWRVYQQYINYGGTLPIEVLDKQSLENQSPPTYIPPLLNCQDKRNGSYCRKVLEIDTITIEMEQCFF